jgi:RimJ/RimL family protein N-acetyltransferase
MIIREIREDDAVQYINFNNQLFSETDFLLFEPGERQISIEDQKARIKSILSSKNTTFFVVEDNGELVGHLGAIGGANKRDKHRAYIIVGILKDYTRRGIGTKLFQELEKWAYENQIHRLELSVMTHNKAGIALYKKMGFEIEGTKKHSLCVHGQYVDEYYMAKLL